MKRIALLSTIALIAGGASLLASGPVPGDISVTCALQWLLGAEPGWAKFLTETAKVPFLWGTILLGMCLAYLVASWRGAIAVPLAYCLALLTDKALRALLHVPKPDADLVAVASASSSSGLPSTFGLVYASLFGFAFWSQRAGRMTRAVRIIAALCIATGCSARVVLGGHWTSQIIPSACIGLLLSGLALWGLRQIKTKPPKV